MTFPYSPLNDAIALAKAVWDTGGTKSLLERLPGRLGHESVRSGAFRNKLGAARLFGLIQTKKVEVSLTPLGERIVDPKHSARARVEAFLAPALFKQIYERHRMALLPGPEALEQEMVDLGIAPKQAERARQVFQRSALQAGFFNEGKDRLVEPHVDDVAEEPTIDEPGTDSGDSERRGGGDQGLQGKPAVIDALFRMLPDEGEPFPEETREKWKQALAVNLDLAYANAGEGSPRWVVTTSSSERERPSERSADDAEETAPLP
jgi:hypothetical protein